VSIVWGIVAGIVGGIIAGMGMGGGTLLIPILTIFLSFTQIEAQGINLIAFIPMAVLALYLHKKNHLIAYKQTWKLAITGAIVSFGSAILANSLKGDVLQIIFALFLMGIGIWQLYEVVIYYRNKKKSKTDLK